jgi:hypothetical protein
VNDKFVKLSAIEQMAKPMAAFHGKGEEIEVELPEDDEMCVCPKCGHKFEHGSEEDESEEY